MDKDILLAVIGTVSAVIISLISLVTALLTVKRTARANQDLEMLRLDQEQIRLLLGINMDTFRETLAAVEEACAVIQKCRDEFRACLPKITGKARQQEIQPALAACDELVNFYQKKYFLFTSEYRIRLHEVKNLSIGAHALLQTTTRRSNNAKIIPDINRYIEELKQAQEQFLIYRDKMISTVHSSTRLAA